MVCLPKSYSEQEREYIIKKLKEEAGKCLVQYGIRRTTVDEIVKRVKIPKGTFYLFYKSKELLLFDVILEQHNLVEEKMFESMSSIDFTSITAQQLTTLLLKFFKLADEIPILKVISSDEVEILTRKLPPEVVAEHFSHDHDMLKQLFSMIPLKPDVNFEILTSTFQAIYLVSLRKEEIGEKNYDEVLRCLIYGVAMQILK